MNNMAAQPIYKCKRYFWVKSNQWYEQKAKTTQINIELVVFTKLLSIQRY